MSDKYVVVGAGIVGLYTTYSLITRLHLNPADVTVLAEYLPGDQSTFYTSPWAGGNFSCISPDDPQTLKFDKFTYTNLAKLQKTLGGKECGLDQRESTEFWDYQPEAAKIKSLSSYLQDWKVLPKSELPDGVAYGINYTTWNFNCPNFLANFKKFLESKGVTFHRQKLTHISQAYLPTTKVVLNCTGIGAHDLGGVQDGKVYPTRGQVVVIKAPHIKVNKVRWGRDYATYIIPRPESGDQLVLGGYLQKDNWTGDTFGHETEDILRRTTELLPEILDRPLDIVRIAAGLRPSRHGGVRIEAEKVEDGKILVHNYGASGYGYQAGFGMANEAIDVLIRELNKAKL
ncbi:unnamed protein product [Kuraishia capsulata CBS 1993]|uniref:FAD dependent oxidoreductase domain-containing protein n=1 Tax=Kuraishia capsulata CBS 1993 TaxID=1382522 RepID=W6MG76_9ASCO|nr:uncharacterized protein KUCA_T00000966001 [Kuraishia capsulata CBS 1993]CDK24999.1 unnamed protein product [Kuraishia capsulata CBS 1993]